MMVASKVFRATLPIGVTPADIYKYRHLGSLPLAAGTTERNGQVPVVECIAVRLQEKLRAQVNLHASAGITDRSFPQWAPCLSAWQALAPEERPDVFLAVIDAAGPDLTIRCGLLETCVADLPPDTATVRLISIAQIVRELRADADKAGVVLPEALTPRYGSPEFDRWVEAIGGEPATRRVHASNTRKAALLAEIDAEMKALRRELQAEQAATAEMFRAAGRSDHLVEKITKLPTEKTG